MLLLFVLRCCWLCVAAVKRDDRTPISDRYNAHLAAQHERAEACRYYKMAAEIVGPEKFLYSSDYAGEMTTIFGKDETEL